MTPLEYFRLLAPEFAGVSDTEVNTWLEVVGNLISPSVLSCLTGEKLAMAKALYAAHMLSLSGSTGTGSNAASGLVTSEREGDLQRTYAQIKGSDTWMGQTSYGRQYQEMTKGCGGGIGILTRVSDEPFY